MGKEILATVDGRKKVIQDIKSSENKRRRSVSLRQFEVYRGNLYPYVREYLARQFSTNTLKEIPIVASINIAQRVVDQEASIYTREPDRDFTELDETQESAIETLYHDSKVDSKLQYANAMYKLAEQTTLMIIPKNGKLDIRVLKNHQVDVVPSENPEVADAYIVSVFKKNESDFVFGSTGGNYEIPRDMINQSIGDSDDYESALEKYLVWTDEFHYIMDGDGNIVGEMLPNPIGRMPFIDIACEKDFEYWIKVASSVVDFCIEYNAALSMQNQVIKMQGFSQAYISGDASVIPESVQIGPNFLLKLANGKTVDGETIETKFGFASPTPDLAGTRAHLEMLLANFLSARGLNTGTVSGKPDAQQYTSGIERLLGMIEQFDASQSDISLFRWVEEELFDIVKRWHNVSLNTDLLDEKYQATIISDDASVNVQYKGPEMVKSEKEIVELETMKMELGVASRVDAIMSIYGIDREDAEKRLKEIDDDEGINDANETESIPEPNVEGNGRQSGIGPEGVRPEQNGEVENRPSGD